MSNAPTKYLPTWTASLLRPEATLRDAMRAIADAGAFMACVVDEAGRLLGILTDSDVRRALLGGADVDDSAASWMMRTPITADHRADTATLLDAAAKNDVREIPLVDEKGRVCDIFVLLMHQHRTEAQDDTVDAPALQPAVSNAMLIVAGGLGTRLRPVVSDLPKPLAVVGSRPILETLILRAVECGIRRFLVSVNYMSEKIAAHLAGPQYAGLSIQVVHERERLGTAGSISLVKNQIREPLLVCNADILTKVPFHMVLRHHESQRASITCTVRQHRTTIPFGVVELDRDGRIERIREKPHFDSMVTTGIYVLSPEVCASVPEHTYLDMPTLIQTAISRGQPVAPFLLHEYWMDIGRPEDFERANREYHHHFGGSSSGK